MKVTLVGRPEAITEQSAFIAFTLLPTEKANHAGAWCAAFLVYVAQKQWRRVPHALDDPEDALIVEGFSLPSADLPATVEIYTMNVTTKKTQVTKRAGHDGGSEGVGEM